MNRIASVCALACFALNAAAATPLDEVAAQITAANPQFAARSAELSAAAASVSAEATLPGLEIEGEYLWGADADNRWGLGVSQSFDWPGVYSARRRAAHASANAFEQLRLAEQAELTLNAKLALIDLVAARRRAAVLSEIYSNVDKLKQFIAKAFDNGQATILDYRKVQIEAINVATLLSRVEQERAEALSAIRAMGYKSDIPEDLSYPESSCNTTDAQSRWLNAPAIAAARAEAVAASARANATAREALPGFALGYRHQFEGGNHFNGISAAIALPSWGSGKKRAAARAEAEAARLQVSAEEARITAEFDATRRTLEARSITIKAYEEALGAPNYIELLQKLLDSGQVDILIYIQEINFYMQASLDYQEALRDYHRTLAKLMKY